MPPPKLVTPLARIPTLPADSVPALEIPPVKVGPVTFTAVVAEVILLALSTRMP